MRKNIGSWVVLAAVILESSLASHDAAACACAPPSGKPVVNADQTVVIAWDPATKIEHFVRRASFKAGADDFGFLVPTPEAPELEEAGDDAFPRLAEITKPRTIYRERPPAGCSGCLRGASKSAAAPAAQAPAAPAVVVLQEKTVAGFHASVLEAKSSTALLYWLREHGYAFSPELEAWAKPYVEAGWKMTALKVAKGAPREGGEKRPERSAPGDTAPRRAGPVAAGDAGGRRGAPAASVPPSPEDLTASGEVALAGDVGAVSAAALRISFKTDRPLFPYREPESAKAASQLGINQRLLRIYLITDARYEGKLGMRPEAATGAWGSSDVVWAGNLEAAARTTVLASLKLPETAVPRDAWLTEFEDRWPYQAAPGDLWFSRAAKQEKVEREPIIIYTSALPRDVPYALGALVGVPIVRRLRRRHRTTK